MTTPAPPPQQSEPSLLYCSRCRMPGHICEGSSAQPPEPPDPVPAVVP